MSALSNQFAEGETVSATAAAKVQHSAAPQFCWEWEATAKVSGKTKQAFHSVTTVHSNVAAIGVGTVKLHASSS